DELALPPGLPPIDWYAGRGQVKSTEGSTSTWPAFARRDAPSPYSPREISLAASTLRTVTAGIGQLLNQHLVPRISKVAATSFLLPSRVAHEHSDSRARHPQSPGRACPSKPLRSQVQ